MTESAKTAFNQKLRQKVSGQSAEKKAAPEELVERAGAALAELQEVIAELAVAPAPDEEEAAK
ncbi:MAG: hypothetical protein M3R38_22110 [Actinomycetota bacterium]|nr:hypothetical protein [Actinomycetota bacterium]